MWVCVISISFYTLIVKFCCISLCCILPSQSVCPHGLWMSRVTLFSELLCSLWCTAALTAYTLTEAMHHGWECFCDKSTSEHAPLNLYLVDPHALFLSLFLYYSLRQTSVWTQTIQSTCLAGWHQVESLSSVYFLLQVSLCVSVMCWDLSVGVTLVFVRLSCMFSLN